MFKFAHMADIHIGAHNDQRLKDLEIEAFNESIDICIKEGVKFIIIAGDFFHTAVPELEQVKRIIKKLRELSKLNIPVYVIYGSHDYNKLRKDSSMIALLEEAGLIVNVYNPKLINGKERLEIHQDRETGVKLVGIAARKVGLEKGEYEKLDREYLESQDGFKIFIFHSGIEECVPAFLKGAIDAEWVPINWFPKGFDYYAGGHIHKRGEYNNTDWQSKFPNYQNVIFPGPSFIGHGRDYGDVAKGEERGLYIVSCEDNKIMENGIKFIEIKKMDGNYIEFDVTGKGSNKANEEIKRKLEKEEVENKLVVLKIKGELSSGKVSDIDFMEMRNSLTKRNAILAEFITDVSSKEYQRIRVSNENKDEIEEDSFRANIVNIKSENKLLQNESGIEMAKELLKILKEAPESGEIKQKVTRDAKEILKISEMIEE